MRESTRARPGSWSPRSLALRAAVAALTLWACDIVLARITSAPQVVGDILLDAAFLTALGVIPVAALAALLPSGRISLLLIALSARLPLLFVVLTILGPPLLKPFTMLSNVLVVSVALLAAWTGYDAWRGREPVPGPVAVTLWVAGSAVASWLVQYAALPPLSLCLPLVAAFVAIAAAARMRLLRPLVAVGALAVALAPRAHLHPTWSTDVPPASGPDIVIFAVDTLRRDEGQQMSAYRRIARRGVAFVNAQAAASWTLPSMGTIFTGLRPPRHGALQLPVRGTGALRRDLATVAERLRRAGYDTAAIVPSPMIGPQAGFDRGFEVWEHESDLYRWSLPRARSARNGRPGVAHLATSLALFERPADHDARYLTRRAIDVLRARRPGRPLLLWVHYLDVHMPYEHADELDLPRWQRMVLENGHADRFREDAFWRSEGGVAVMRRAYRHQIKYVDASINDILDALGPPPERGRLDVLLSDHGEEFFERGGLFHGHSHYQELVSVPLAIAGLPGRALGSVEHAVVGHIDIAPTLLAAAGLPTEGLQGQNLAGAVEGRVYVSENLHEPDPGATIAVRWDQYKLILGRRQQDAKLFDLDRDPAEESPLAHPDPGILERLRVATRFDGPVANTHADFSEEDRRMLEALGYAE